jgi:hypothetical protein
MSATEMSLGEAARFAGVSQTTVRTWVHKIAGAQKLPSGGYSIPMNALQNFLAVREKGGMGRTGAFPQSRGATVLEQGYDKVHGQVEVEYLRGELREARSELKEAQAEIRRLNAEVKALLSGGAISSLSRWIKAKIT